MFYFLYLFIALYSYNVETEQNPDYDYQIILKEDTVKGLKSKIDKDHDLKMIQKGNKTPEGKLIGENDEISFLKDFRGSLLVVNFWASWCSPCIKGTPKFIKTAELFDNEKVKFITVSIDDPIVDWKDFLKKQKWEGNNFWLGKNELNPLYAFVYEKVKIDSSQLILISLPKYVIISSEGMILNNNAAHAGSKDFEDEIRKYL